MSDSGRYIERAEQAEKLASEMTSRDHRDQLLQIARDWRNMAEKAVAAEERVIPKRDRSQEPKAS